MGPVFVECMLGILLALVPKLPSSFSGTSLRVHWGELYMPQGPVTVV